MPAPRVIACDAEEVERFIAYCARQKPFPLRGFYRLLGYAVPDCLPARTPVGVSIVHPARRAREAGVEVWEVQT
mgnify:CR=1 FL=1